MPITHKRRLISDQIADVLREEILNGDRPPGSALRQGHIAAMFESSQGPVREALARLEAENLVQSMPNRGSVVAPLDRDEILEIGELRALLEPELVRIAAESGDRVDRAAGEAALRDMTAAKTSQDLMLANARFHDVLFAPSDRPVTVVVVRALRSRFERALRLMWSSSGNRSTSKAEHSELLELVANGQSEQASDLARRHVEGTTRRVLKALPARDPDHHPTG
jgi:DNA-binding GntR family transcriptional regulator